MSRMFRGRITTPSKRARSHWLLANESRFDFFNRRARTRRMCLTSGPCMRAGSHQLCVRANLSTTKSSAVAIDSHLLMARDQSRTTQPCRQPGGGYAKTTDTCPTFRPRARSRTMISMSLPRRVRQSMSFRSEMPRNCPRSNFESLGCGKPRY